MRHHMVTHSVYQPESCDWKRKKITRGASQGVSRDIISLQKSPPRKVRKEVKELISTLNVKVHYYQYNSLVHCIDHCA